MPPEPTARESKPPALIRTPDQRLRVFVSSTLEELAPERAAARAAIEDLRLTPVMFELGARPHPPRDLYRAYLEQSHVFIGIYWRRYGWIAPGESVSGLEDEYLLSGTRPRLIYIKGSDPDVDPRLAELIERIRADESASYRVFTSDHELRALIQDDLAVLLTERFEQAAAPPDGRLPEWARTNLPTPRNPLIGREVELGLACDLLTQDSVGLVTLLGPGGSGKSRLALEIGLELLGRFSDGIFLVPLETIGDADLVVPTIARTLQVPGAPQREALDELAASIGDSHLLLLLDNFEQVVGAGSAISLLLERCPRLVVLATSRTPLRIQGERRLEVQPLPVPASSEHNLQSLSQYAAVALFIQRAQWVLPEFAVTRENAPIVAEICARLDGLPLAIELAAARLRLLPPHELLARLTRSFDVLHTGARDLPERQRTLRGTIDWSHELLDEQARTVFRRLSVFSGGATLEAAEAVATAADDLEGDPLHLIASLVDDSMVGSSVSASGDLRIEMLDTMRDYASEQLAGSGEEDRVRQVHAEWFTSLAERAGPHLSGPEEAKWAAHLEAEHPNLRSALDWSASHDPDLALRICASIWRFWESHGYIVEGRQWLERAVAGAGEGSPPLASALHAAAAFACYLGDYPSARSHVDRALSIWEKTANERGTARAFNEIGVIAMYEGHYQEAEQALDRALKIKRELGDPVTIANSLTNLGLVASYKGDLERAEELHRESLTIYGRHGDRLGVALASGNLAHLAMLNGRLDEARSGQIESLALFRELGDDDGIAECLERLAMIAEAEGDFLIAVRLFGLASAVRDKVGTVRAAFELTEFEQGLDIARANTDRETFEHEWEIGRQMSIDEAVEGLNG